MLAIVGAYIALCLLYVAFTPIGEGPDELDHIRYVEHLVRFGSFAPIAAGGSSMPYTLEAKQPPAYYLLNAALMLALGRGGKPLAPDLQPDPDFGKTPGKVQWYLHPPVSPDLLPWTYIMRLLGVLMGVGTIVLVFATVREVFPSPDARPLAVGAAALVGLLPQFTFISSVVNNDNFTTLVGAAVAYCLVRTIQRGIDLRGAAILGVLLGLTILSKVNGMLYIPIVMLVLVSPGVRLLPAFAAMRFMSRVQSLLDYAGRRLLVLVVSLSLCALVGGWWLARNALVYGDVLARGAVNDMAAQVIPKYASTFNPAAPDAAFTQLFVVLATHFGAFGWVTIKAPLILYLLYTTLLALAALGIVAHLGLRKVNLRQAACLLLGILTTGLFYAVMVYNSVGQGRLLFPALAFTSLLVTTGTYGWLRLVLRGRQARAVAYASATVWIVFLGLSNVYSVFVLVIPAFR